MYRMDAALSLILLVPEMLKIPRAKVESHFLKKLAFVTNKGLAMKYRKSKTRDYHQKLNVRVASGIVEQFKA